MSGFLGSQAITALVAALVVGVLGFVFAWNRTNPNRSRSDPQRVRMPRFMAGFGVVMMLLAVVFALVLPRADATDRLPMAVFTVLFVVGGGLFLLLYVNWYLIVRGDHLVFRGLLTGERTIWYRDIVRYSLHGTRAAPLVTIRAADGTKFTTNYRTFDVTPLLRAIEFHRATGHWPGVVPPFPPRHSHPAPGFPQPAPGSPPPNYPTGSGTWT